MNRAVISAVLAIGCVRSDALPAALGSPAPTAQAPLLRGGFYFGTPERFNRAYTDPSWQPRRTLFVSARGRDDVTPESSTPGTPTSVAQALAAARPGDEVRFLGSGGRYAGCYELVQKNSGTYDAPVVLRAEPGVQVDCCDSGRAACFNLEGAAHVAVIGFELIGGSYGVRAVGLGTRQQEHQQGLAILDTVAHDQWKDPFFTAHSSWAVLDGNTGYGAGDGDGHGIYISNGSDRVVIRRNELYENASSDLQVNADPAYSCTSFGIPLRDEVCWGAVEDGMGAGISELLLIEDNFLHDGGAQGPNFTSMRRSVVRGNIFGPYARHGVSFWQETDLPALGSASNTVEGNLIVGVTPWSHALQFIRHADNNVVSGNVLLGLSADLRDTSTDVLLVEIGEDTDGNRFSENIYVGGRVERAPADFTILRSEVFSSSWFVRIPQARTPADWAPTDSAPFSRLGGWQPPSR